jgi:hypothetical protein
VLLKPTFSSIAHVLVALAGEVMQAGFDLLNALQGRISQSFEPFESVHGFAF